MYTKSKTFHFIVPYWFWDIAKPPSSDDRKFCLFNTVDRVSEQKRCSFLLSSVDDQRGIVKVAVAAGTDAMKK